MRPMDSSRTLDTQSSMTSNTRNMQPAMTKEEMIKKSEASIKALADSIESLLQRNKKAQELEQAIQLSEEERDLDWLNYLTGDNNLARFWSGASIGPEETDSVIETFTLVNTLLLSVPFNCIGALNSSYWDWLQESLQACANWQSPMSQSDRWVWMYDQIESFFYMNIYCAIAAINMAVLYFILRPTNAEQFHKWWQKGRWVVVFILIATTLSVLAVLAYFGLMSEGYMNGTNEICGVWDGSDSNNKYSSRYAVGLVLLSFSLVVSFFIMF